MHTYFEFSLIYHHVAEFKAYFDYVQSLRFDDRPDYDYLKRIFRELFFRKGFTFDNMYDWDILSLKTETTAEESKDDVEGRESESSHSEREVSVENEG